MNTTSYSFHIDGADIPIIVRRHPSSRRMIIRYQPRQNSISLTLPRYVGIRQGLDFISSKRNWIASQLDNRIEPVQLQDGVLLPLVGETYTLRHVGGRGVARFVGDELHIHGDSEFMERRTLAFIKKFAQDVFTQKTHEKAALLGVKARRISLRDNSSCWGSCTPSGNLSFSWRVIFAAPEVLDYLVCHEVSHLLEHNHSKRFWKLVESLCPDWKTHRDWLHQHGKELYRFGASA